MPSDLRFTQLEKPESNTGPLIVLDSSHGPIIRIASLIPTISRIDSNVFGVVELMYKLMERCNEAQTKTNVNA